MWILAIKEPVTDRNVMPTERTWSHDQVPGWSALRHGDHQSIFHSYTTDPASHNVWMLLRSFVITMDLVSTDDRISASVGACGLVKDT